jgi:hypothetical protein
MIATDTAPATKTVTAVSLGGAAAVGATVPNGVGPDVRGIPSWSEANRRHLYAALDVMRLEVERACRTLDERTPNGGADPPALAESDVALGEAVARVARADAVIQGHSTLAALVDVFGLSPFERDVLLMAAGVRLVPDFAVQLAAATRTKAKDPTFELAFRLLPGPHWAAITPTAPLRRNHLLQLERPDDPVASPFRIDERILFFLLGLPTVDARLGGLVEPVTASNEEMVSSYAELADQIALIWTSRPERPVIQLAGADAEGKRTIAVSGAAKAGLLLYRLRGVDAHCEPSQRVFFASLLDRELALGGAALLVAMDDDDADEARAVRALVARLRAPVIVARRSPLAELQRPEIRLDVESLAPADQRRLWRSSLAGALSEHEDVILDRVIGHFRFGPVAIRSTAAALGSSKPERRNPEELWEACRRRGRMRLSDLAQRIASKADWDDLILPPAQKQVLRDITAHLGHTTTVHERWGFGRRGARGLALTALFSGDSGTGKTLAAEVIANEVKLDLWRVDLSRMLDKYIGETEKNLRRIFDAAEESGAILLFDEADALFSKRTEVRNSVDRFGNVEVGYLLQRMETYAGLAILTTNLGGSIDTAFMRRLRFAVQFPFPKPEQRALIWSRAFPPETPTAGLNVARLAQLNLAGGNIRNIALNGAFLAAAERRPVGMVHLLRAARLECAKLERPLAAAEVAGWE